MFDGALEELFDYKNQLMEDILTSEKVVRLLNDEYAAGTEAGALAYKQVFPFEYIPETVEHGKTFICFDVDIQKSLNSTYFKPVIYVWVFTHKSLLRLPGGGGVRTDMLASEIARLLNGSRKYGLGELDLYAIKRFAPINDYQGKVMTFNAKEFNRLSPGQHPIPSNRKHP